MPTDLPQYRKPGTRVIERPEETPPPARPGEEATGHDVLRWADGTPVAWADTSPVYLSGLIPVTATPL